MSFSLRLSTPADADFVTMLEETCMSEYARALWPDWTPSVPRYGFDVGRHRIVVVERHDVGCVDVWHKPDHRLLDKLYLVPELRGHGLGTAILRQVIGEAQAAQLPLRLSVLSSNPRARKLYEREGFVVIEDDGQRAVMDYRGEDA